MNSDSLIIEKIHENKNYFLYKLKKMLILFLKEVIEQVRYLLLSRNYYYFF